MKQVWKDSGTQTDFQTLMTHITNQHQREQENHTYYLKYRLETVSIVHRLMMLSWKTINHTQQLKHPYQINL